MIQRHLLSPQGFVAGAVHAGIKSRQTPDVGLLLCRIEASAAAAFTTNKVFAASVKIGRRHIAGGRLRGVVVNSGNANACTGPRGEEDTLRMCRLAARAARCRPGLILPSSTGIIGRPMPMDKIERGIERAAASLGSGPEHATLFARAIMTTDTRMKSAEATFRVGTRSACVAGVCKGSGMIGPRMVVAKPHATMLAYMTTDAVIAPPLLARLLAEAVDDSFNSVTVDDHASTNDTAAIMASGLSSVRIESAAAARSFAAALQEVCRSLALQIAADGEGATKVVAVNVRQASGEAAARAIARAIANSPLVKCAMHGNDPNWGRIVSAAGYAGVPFNPDRSTLRLQGTCVFRRGQPVRFDAAAVSKKLHAAWVEVDLDCGTGKGHAVCWTCDLSKDYVTINADYHT